LNDVGDRLITQGDARDLGSLGVEPESVDCFLTSPPYFNLKRYDADAAAELGQGQELDGYLADLQQILASCHTLAKPTGVLWLVVDTFRAPAKTGGLGELAPLPFQIVDAAREVGWRLQEVVIWEKNKTLPYSGQGKLRNLIEYVLLLTKSQEFKHRPFRLADRHGSAAEWLSGWPERYHPLGKRPANIWNIPIPTQGMWAHSERLHFCPFPQELVARCLELTTDKGDLVFDPFAGIGTVPAQAEAMGRRGRGLELNEAFIEIFEQQILPAFQAAWESKSFDRELAREDQLREAETILLLRSLKAGKEMSRLLERWTLDRPRGAPAAAIESVVVEPPLDLPDHLDIGEGSVARPPVALHLVAATDAEDLEDLHRELMAELAKPPFSTLGLELSIQLTDRGRFLGDGECELHEFEQSRRASYSRPITLTPETAWPRLLTTVALSRVVQGDKLSPLDVARKEAERRVVTSEHALSTGTADLADRLGVTQAEVQELLIEHGIGEPREAFGIAIPGAPSGS
jgi:DNA modification methylase